VRAANRTLWDEYHKQHRERARMERFVKQQEEDIRQSLRKFTMGDWIEGTMKKKSKYLLEDELFEID